MSPVTRTVAASTKAHSRRCASATAVSTVAITTVASLVGDRGLGYPIFYALELPTPFKTEIYSAGFLIVALALSLDFCLVLVRRRLVRWAR